jgi:hypothetical protein
MKKTAANMKDDFNLFPRRQIMQIKAKILSIRTHKSCWFVAQHKFVHDSKCLEGIYH